MMLSFNHKGHEGFNIKAELIAKKPLFMCSPTTEAVGSNFCNILGTNGFSRWSTTLTQVAIRLHGLLRHLIIETLCVKKNLLAISSIIAIAITIVATPVFSQHSQGGLPSSFRYQLYATIPEIVLPSPDLSSIRSEDDADEKQALPRRVAVAVDANLDLMQQTPWQILPDGSGIKQWRISCEGALALSLCFSDFHLTEGSELFIYDDERQYIIGAFTANNNKPHRLFATGLIPGDAVTIEINAGPEVTTDPVIFLSEVSYLYRDLPAFLGVRGPSDHCEVNINCPEGADWQKQKRGITRIYVKKQSGFFWCTGSLVNNARKDLTPYLLTADHCAPSVTPGDLSQWIFYFNFEAPECENPVVTPPSSSLSGAVKLAGYDTDGSDFLLLMLDDEVPESYNPFFNGWSRENIPSPRGVTIHHPNGDIRKISTYTQPLVSSQWSSTAGTHWMVHWSPTETNWGVTEGGSSGAPLFDNNGRIIGTLTGGMAACDPGGIGAGSGPDQPDYYGKFSYSWDQNGAVSAQQLMPWLDPDNTGVTILPGMNSALTAAFEADEHIILTGGSVTFLNLSSGLPISWEWEFEGGTPATFTGPEPPAILYNSAGLYDVSLIVSDGLVADTLYYRDFIQVVGKVYPNPTAGMVYIYLNEEMPSLVKAEVITITGQVVLRQDFPDHNSRLVSLDLSPLSAGIYIVRLQVKGRYVFAKVMRG